MSGGRGKEIGKEGRKERLGHWQGAVPVFRKHASEMGVWRGEAWLAIAAILAV